MYGVALGFFAAALQVAGYLFYIRGFLRKAIRPNAASYVMFAYGTALVAFLAWESGATPHELILPVACAGMSLFVAGLCLRNNMTDPVDRFEGGIFVADILLTIAYGALVLGDADRAQVSPAFLLLSNVTTLTCFIPILRSTWRSPGREQPLPWIIWTCAYLALTAATLVETGLANPVLLLYPVLNAGLHLGMTLLSVRQAIWPGMFRDGDRALYHGNSPIAGLGVFAGRKYRQGDIIWTLSGPVHKSSETHANPDFVGLGPGLWIDPARPLDKLNHSCNPNAAFGRRRELVALRDVGTGEEITFDYSTTEVDPEWTMACTCGATGCRRGLHAIQVSFADQDAPPAASPLMQLVWRKRRQVPQEAAPAFPQLADGAVHATAKPARAPKARTPRHAKGNRTASTARKKAAAPTPEKLKQG